MFIYNRVDRDVLKLLTNDQLLHLVKSYISKNTMTDRSNSYPSRFLMCSLPYQNAQRQGPVCNLKRSELSWATKHTVAGEGVYVCRVWEHKTSGQFGSANVVVPEHIHSLIVEYDTDHKPSQKMKNMSFSHLVGAKLPTSLMSYVHSQRIFQLNSVF